MKEVIVWFWLESDPARNRTYRVLTTDMVDLFEKILKLRQPGELYRFDGWSKVD